MNLRGHVGFAVTVLSSAFLLLGLKDGYYLKVLILSAALSSLPDIDLKVGLSHRKYTHNLFFVAVTSLLFGYLTSTILDDFNLGFYSAMASGLLHILSDMMTCMRFAPFYPISDRNVALRLVRSNNRFVNDFFVASGVLLLILYIRFCYNL